MFAVWVEASTRVDIEGTVKASRGSGVSNWSKFVIEVGHLGVSDWVSQAGNGWCVFGLVGVLVEWLASGGSVIVGNRCLAIQFIQICGE